MGQKILEIPLFESMVNLETSSPQELLAGRSPVVDEGLSKIESEIEATQKRGEKGEVLLSLKFYSQLVRL